jgi:ABC-type sugar transport system substrate-binding protein
MRGLPIVVIAVVSVGLVAGCGSGSSSGSSGEESGSQSTVSSKELASFEAKAAAALKASPTEFAGPTEPVPAPKSMKLAVISCAKVLEGCQAPTEAAAEAAEALGWTVREYDGEGTGPAENKAMLNAISWGAEAIANMSIAPELVQQGLRAAKEAGVTVFSGDNGIESPNPTIKPEAGTLGYAFDVSVNWPALGEAAANWIIADSKGKANVVVFADNEFPGARAETKGLVAQLEKCKTCTLQPIQTFTSSQVGTQLSTNTTAYVQNNPEVEYMWSAFDPAAVTQIQALRQAGLGDEIKLVSTIGDQQNLEFIKNEETQVADAAYDNVYLGYASIDQFLRLLAKQPLFEPRGENVPFVVLDKTNVEEAGSSWVAPFDYKAKFESLWQQ